MWRSYTLLCLTGENGALKWPDTRLSCVNSCVREDGVIESLWLEAWYSGEGDRGQGHGGTIQGAQALWVSFAKWNGLPGVTVCGRVLGGQWSAGTGGAFPTFP